MSAAEPTADQLDEGLVPEGSPRLVDGVDPELVALPQPSQGRRILTLVLMAMTVVACLILVRALTPDLRYFMSAGAVTELGEITSLAPADTPKERYVHIDGSPMASQTIRYDRAGGRFALTRLSGPEDVYIEIPEEEGDFAAITAARREFSGRLTTFRALGSRYEPLRGHLEDHMGAHVSRDARVVLANRTPASAWWTLAAALLCAFFVLLNLVLIVRWFRPLKKTAETSATVA
ncbi:MAG: hypothetical protein ACI9KE_002032 [Polyangiales bacterium]|jgi:hypothetical protein